MPNRDKSALDYAAIRHSEVEEIRHRLINRYGLLMAAGGGLAWLTIGGVGLFDRNRFFVFGLVWLSGLLALFVNRRHQLFAQLILMAGSLATVWAIWLRVDNTIIMGVAAIVVVMNHALSPAQGRVSALLLALLVWRLFGLQQAAWLPLLILLGLAVATMSVHNSVMATVVEWSWAAQRQASELLHEARERRGDLARTLFSLTEATRRIERTRHELAIARGQAEEARHIKALFAANISHELRTPLNLIIGFSEMMVHTPEVYGELRWPPALRTDIREIHSSASQLMAMIDDILDLSRIDADRLPLRLEAVELAELVDEATRTVRGLIKSSDVRIVVAPLPELPTLLVDRARVRQVIINLLNNAVRFTDHGSITVSATRGDDTYSVSVTDTGVGIPDDQLSAIFEEFGQARGSITSNRGGIGLGLAICRQFVHLHGGTIGAESTLGQGSTFTFTLPLPGSSSASHLSYYAPMGWSPDVPENPMGRTALLLAPDERSVQALARSVVGYRCMAVEQLDDLPALVASEHPDGLVLIDDPLVPTMPSPRDLWSASQRLDLPIIRCEVPLGQVLSDQLGIARYLIKPVRRDDLVEAISQREGTPGTFLVVDDDPGFVSLIQRTMQLEYPQAKLFKAYSCAEARQMLAETQVDVVLMDLILPDGSGLELVRELLEEGALSGEHVVITSGSSYPEEVSRLRPSRIELMRAGGFQEAHTGGYISALLQVHPPDYTRPAPAGPPPAFVVEQPAF